MQITERNYHLRLMEMAECYLNSEYQQQLEKMGPSRGTDQEEDGLKYLALALMVGITEKAREVRFKEKHDHVKVVVKNKDEIRLPAPSPSLFAVIYRMMAAILHVEGEEGEGVLVFGLPNSEVELQVTMSRSAEKTTLHFTLPQL